jgi:predicted metal-dependent hydrolase
MSRPEIIDTPAGPALLKRSHRKTLAISVLPGGTLELAAPDDAPLEAIVPRVAKRLPWIRQQRRRFASMNATRPPMRYVTGATHRYLGRQYRLKLHEGESSKVALQGAYFHITTPTAEADAVKQALDAWYRKRALEQFTKRLQSWSEWCRHRNLPEPKLRLRRMNKRWGSSLQDGSIYLNPELILAPSACVDYVIAHEICHLKHPDHGRRFRSLLAQQVPDWRELKQRLEAGS